MTSSGYQTIRRSSISRRDRRWLKPVVALAIALYGGSCSSSPVAPTAPPPSETAPIRETVTSVTLTSTLGTGFLPRIRRGEQMTFTAEATGGTPPIEFRWKANGTIVRGWSTVPTFTWDGTTTADGLQFSGGRVYFWVETRSGGRADSERNSPVLEFDMYNCQGADRQTPFCAER